MKAISNEEGLKHYGIPGMKWGQRKAEKATTGVVNAYRREAERQAARSDLASARSHWNEARTFKPKYLKEMKREATAYNRDKRAENSRKLQNLSKGAMKAKKLVSGMDMSQAISTLDSKNGMSRNKQVLANILYGPTSMGRLQISASIYANKVTDMGNKDIGDE